METLKGMPGFLMQLLQYIIHNFTSWLITLICYICQCRTLYDQLNRCVTAFGKRLLKSWLARPLYDIDSIKERQEAVAGVKVLWVLTLHHIYRLFMNFSLYSLANPILFLMYFIIGS